MKKTLVFVLLVIAGSLQGQPIMKMDPTLARERWKSLTTGTNLAIGCKVTFSQPPTYNLTATGGTDATDLTDGKLCDVPDDRIWFDPKAVGWYESGASGGVNILLDLGAIKPIDRAVLRVMGGRPTWCMLLPQRIEVLVSKDGTAFYPISTLDKLKPGESAQSDWVKTYYVEENGTAFVFPFDLRIQTEARYVGFTVYGETDAMYMDEIAVMAPKTPLTAGQVASVYRGKPTGFYTSGLVVRPRIGKLVISRNVTTPNHLMYNDMRPGKGINDSLHLTAEVPANVDLAGPKVEKREKVTLDGKACKKLTFTISKCRWKIPFTNSVFFAVTGELPAGATATIYDADNAKNPVRQTVPIEAIDIPEVSPAFGRLHVSLSWMDEMESLAWPHFMTDWKKMGFNAIGTFPRYCRGPEAEKGRDVTVGKFLADARRNGYKIVVQENPSNSMQIRQKPGSEMFSQLDDGKGSHLCPTYRGKYYKADLDFIKANALACRPDYVFWDIELWQEGGDDGLTGRCKRCKAAIEASGKPAAEFLKDAGTEIFRDTYNAVKAASVEGKFPMPVVGSYNHHALDPVHQVVSDFDRNYPKYLQQAQPSLYVGGRAQIVHRVVRGNYQKLHTRDILPWLSAGTYGEFEPRKLEPMILEALLNGAIGFTYYWDADFDTPLDFYYHARPLAILAPYEKLLMDGRVLEPTGSNSGLYYSGIGSESEVLLLVGNYDSRDEKTVCQLPAGITRVKDLVSGERVPVENGKVKLAVPKDGYRLLYGRKLPKVLLLGDSIRMGYQPLVAELLKGRAEVVAPAENGGRSSYTLQQLDNWLKQLGTPDIVHWNNGLHDTGRNRDSVSLQASVAEYRGNLEKIYKKLHATGASVVWATSTPFSKTGALGHPDWYWRRDELGAYNQAAAQLMQSLGIPIDDLHRLVEEHMTDYIGADGLHLNEVGKRACAEHVVAALEPLLK